jgi:hypothetical protein
MIKKSASYLGLLGGLPLPDGEVPAGGDELGHVGMPRHVAHTPAVTLIHLPYYLDHIIR